MKQKSEMSYTEALEKIEANLRRIENNQDSIEQILDMSRETATLIRYCKGQLKGLEKEVEEIIALINEEEEQES